MTPKAIKSLFNKPDKTIFDLLPITLDDIVFIGDSLTKEFPVTEMFNNIHVKNRGIRHATSADIKERFKKIASARPKKIFLQVGLNDLRAGVDLNQVFKNFKEMAESVQSLLIVQSLIPNGDFTLIEPIERYNILTGHYCLEHHIPFVDLYPFFDEGTINRKYTYDGTHLNGAGYLVWKGAVEGLV